MEKRILSLTDIRNELSGGEEMMMAITHRIFEEAKKSKEVEFQDVDDAMNEDINKLNNLQAGHLRKLGYEVGHNRHTHLWIVSGW